VSRFVLIPGAGGEASYWHRVVPLLEARGHQAIAVDLPGHDPAAGLPEYTEIVLAAIGDGRDHVLVAQSLARLAVSASTGLLPVHAGGPPGTVPIPAETLRLVAARLPEELVLVRHRRSRSSC
jgi:pimeloyl-ACP methyl ester carboxylesterase